MKKACLIAALVCFSAFFAGCGSSSSDKNNGTLPTTDNTVDSFCANNPMDQQCQTGNQQQCQQQQPNNGAFGNTNGYNTNQQTTCYPVNQNGVYQDSPFGMPRGACNCPGGFMPIRSENGGIQCLNRQTTTVTNAAILVTFSSGHKRSRRNGHRDNRTWNNHTFDFILEQQSQTIDRVVPGQGNCYQQLPIGCNIQDPYGSCSHVSRPGMPALCVPANGGQSGQGICVNQSVPNQ